MTIIEVLLIAGAIQGFFLSFMLLFSHHGSRPANKVLSIFLLFFGTGIVLHVLGHNGYLTMLPDHIAISFMLSYSYAPLLYLFTAIITGKKNKFRHKDLLHFIPFFVSAISMIIFFLLKENSHETTIASALDKLIRAVIFPYSIIYIIAITATIKGHKKRIENNYSSIEKVNLKWLKILLTLIILFSAIDGTLAIFFHEKKDWDFMWLFVSCYMYIIGYFALKQAQIVLSSVPDKDDYDESKKKYKRSTLTKKQAEEILIKLDDALQNRKIYLTENLALPALAVELSVSVHHLSQVINEQYNMNFYKLINQNRVEEAKIALAKDKYRNITDVALEIGFNSLSAFNSDFKQFTGQTPSEFKAQLQNTK